MPEERPHRILVVEDEEEIQVLVGRILHSVGHEVTAARDGEEGLERIAEERPDLMILDLFMPRMDGWGVIREMRPTSAAGPVVYAVGFTLRCLPLLLKWPWGCNPRPWAW